MHRALADVIDPELDPDRRAWHRAHAAVEPDEEVATELERSADRAQARGGLAAAAAFLEEAARLTVDPACRAERALSAAQAKHDAGSPDAALGLLAMARAGPFDELRHARIDLLRAQITFASARGNDAPPLLLKAARQLEPLDMGLARETYLEAFTAAVIVGRLSYDASVVDVARAARAAPAPSTSLPASDLVLDGLALLVTEGRAAATPLLKQAVSAFRTDDIPAAARLRWGWLVQVCALELWDDESWDVLSGQHVRLARQVGALTVLPIGLRARVFVHGLMGRARRGRRADRRGASSQRSGRDPALGLRRRDARRLAGARGRGVRALSRPRSTMRWAVARGFNVAISHYADRVTQQRARPLCRGHGRGGARHAITTMWVPCHGR